jgi:hypothetical protein
LAKLKITKFRTTFIFASNPKNEFLSLKNRIFVCCYVANKKKNHFLFPPGPPPPFWPAQASRPSPDPRLPPLSPARARA